MTDEQKYAVEEISNLLSEAGARMRDLITEHQSIYERLEVLRSQHHDLEQEYTKLVEQQLGE